MIGENKMKKFLAIFLVACFILCLSACGNKENSSDLSNNNSQTTSTQTQTNTSDESSDHSESNTLNNSNASNDLSNSNGADGSSNNTSIDTNNSNGTNSSSNSNNTNSSNNSNGTNGTNNSNPPPHTHSYSDATCTAPAKCSCGATNGSALGHKWQDATCKAPKTCSVCKKAEGNKAEHIVEGTTCKWCKQPVAVSPSNLKNKIYSICKPFELPDDWDTGAKYAIIISTIDFKYNDFCGGDMYSEYIPRPDYTPSDDSLVYYEGKTYHSDTQWYDVCEFEKQISNNRIILLFDGGNNGKIELELLSNNTIKVVSVSGKSWEKCVKIGDIYS